MRVLVTLVGILCCLLGAHSVNDRSGSRNTGRSNLPRRAYETWHVGILNRTTSSCDQLYPERFSRPGCLVTGWAVEADRMCKSMVDSCWCLPQFVITAVSKQKPDQPIDPVFLCIYLVNFMHLHMPACCEHYYPNTSNNQSRRNGNSTNQTRRLGTSRRISRPRGAAAAAAAMASKGNSDLGLKKEYDTAEIRQQYAELIKSLD